MKRMTIFLSAVFIGCAALASVSAEPHPDLPANFNVLENETMGEIRTSDGGEIIMSSVSWGGAGVGSAEKTDLNESEYSFSFLLPVGIVESDESVRNRYFALTLTPEPAEGLRQNVATTPIDADNYLQLMFTDTGNLDGNKYAVLSSASERNGYRIYDCVLLEKDYGSEPETEVLVKNNGGDIEVTIDGETVITAAGAGKMFAGGAYLNFHVSSYGAALSGECRVLKINGVAPADFEFILPEPLGKQPSETLSRGCGNNI